MDRAMISQQPGEPAPDAPRVAIVDADWRIRRSLGSLLSLAGLAVTGEAGNVDAAMDLVDAEEPALLLIDPRLPDLPAGEALIAAVGRRHPDTRVLLMGWSSGTEQGPESTGSAAFLRKDSTPEEFVAATLAACDCLVPGAPSGS